MDEGTILAMSVHLHGIQLDLFDERVDGETVAALAASAVADTQVNLHGLSTWMEILLYYFLESSLFQLFLGLFMPM